jgi:hypothetical protein
VAAGGSSRVPSPSLGLSATTSLSSTPTSTSPVLVGTAPALTSQHQQANPSLPRAFPPAAGDPSIIASTTTGSIGLARSASAALQDDVPDSPRPRKRPRTQRLLDPNGPTKFDSFVTDTRKIPVMRESNGTSSPGLRNGVGKETINGTSSAINGSDSVLNDSQISDRFFGHSREEVTRLIIQTLDDLGYAYAPKPSICFSC